MTCNRKVRVDGEYLKLNIQDSSEKVSYFLQPDAK